MNFVCIFCYDHIVVDHVLLYYGTHFEKEENLKK